ncbi:MAG TPA: response regulator transcription factor [Candidatus Acidoferrum sp.]|nr:response regulator transcription factor [Candidatus Acidoferrum sp.]
MSPGPIRVLVVDDQTLVREGLVTMLRLTPGVEVVGAASDGAAAVDMAVTHRPDVVLMDLRMPRVDGVQATSQILERRPDTRVIVLTTYADDESVFAALQAGARGYLTKDASVDEIGRAIRTVHAGDALLDPTVQRRLLETVAGQRSMPVTAREGFPDGLTQREVDVLRCMAEGLSNQDIASRLHVSEATVKTHINNIFSKAELRDRGQAVAYAFRQRLVSR